MQNNPRKSRKRVKKSSPISDQQKTSETPVDKRSPFQQQLSPNSDSFSLIYGQFFPRTPIKKIQMGKESSKDQLEQLIDKGILSIALVQQVSFNSTQNFDWLKNNLDLDPLNIIPKRYQHHDLEALKHFINELKKNLEICQVYEKSVRVDATEPSMLNPKSMGDQDHTKQQYITTLLNVYANFRKLKSKDHFFTIANPNYIIFFGYKEITNEVMMQEELLLVPFALFITRSAATSNSFTLRNNQSIPLILSSNHIKSTCISVDPLLNNLIPSVVSLQFPTKYSVNLIKGKYIHHLLNVLVNNNSEKEVINIAASFPFHGSSSNVTQIYNGIDYLVTDFEPKGSNSFFDSNLGHQEFKIQFDGILTIQQVLNIKNSLKDLGYHDIVVSETKLNPITTLLTQSTFNKISQALSNP